MSSLSISSVSPDGRPPRLRQSAGVTLAEAAVVLGAVAVLISISVPSMAEWTVSLQRNDLANTMLLNLYRARNEAVKRNGRVALCKSADGAMCATVGGWEQGLIVFVDGNNNGHRDAGEVLIHREPALPTGWRLVGNASVRDRIGYGAEGMTRMESGAFQAGSIVLCRESAEPHEGRQIIVNSSGRPRVQKVAVDSCP